MESLVWLAVGAALLVVLHVAMVAYLYRRASEPDTPAGPEELGTSNPSRERSEPTRGVPDTADVDGSEHVPCPTCGTPNDPSYRFCRHCITDLTSGRRAGAGRNPEKRLGN